MAIPSRYRYLLEEPYPPIMVRVAMGMHGTYEFEGGANNPLIIAWADEIERVVHTPYNQWAADFYNSDKIPWCALFMGVCAVRSAGAATDRFPPKGYLAALSWASFGVGVPRKLENIEVGDVIVLTNTNHVTLAVGVTDRGTVVGIGGNQSNSVNIKEFAFSRVYAIRRPPYKNKPAGARHVVVGSTGLLSSGER